MGGLSNEWMVLALVSNVTWMIEGLGSRLGIVSIGEGGKWGGGEELAEVG